MIKTKSKTVSKTLPPKFRVLPTKDRVRILNQLTVAAETAVAKGWHIFPCIYEGKIPFKGTHGSRDARAHESILSKWRTGQPANPAIRLDRSGLTVLDIDSGASSVEDVLSWMTRNNIPDTLIVASGRSPFGCHLYFQGVRTLPDVQPNKHLKVRRKGFELDGIHGDIKCHGHVIIAGGLHKSGSTYTVVHDRPIAPLPQWLKNWEEASVKEAKAKYQRYVDKVVAGRTEFKNLIPAGERNSFLLKEASHLHWRGLDELSILTAVVDICKRFCEEGENYAKRKEANLKTMVAWVAKHPYTRLVRPKPVTTGSVVLSRVDTPKDKLAGWLTSRFTLGEQVSIHTILVRFSTDHPDEPAPPRMTLSRAMKAANFRKSGKDPADKRLPLWTRVGSPDSPKDIVMLSSDVGMVRTFAGGAQ
jgi:hypothetical protein